ncbi:MAG: hypothetical protein M3Y80_02260 [Verrucomicrobiota bacterium]|nr:hypothetical protein [Verrucomicrobiota bacterium]
MTKDKKKTRRPHKRSDTSPARLLSEELQQLRRDLRATVRALSARLEIALAESTATIANSAAAETLSREQMHVLRDLMMMVRKRKLKPEKGRRKDLRKLDVIISDLHACTHPVAPE